MKRNIKSFLTCTLGGLLLLSLFAACDISDMQKYWNYEFNNATRYSIRIELNETYYKKVKNADDENEYIAQGKSFSIDRNSSKTVIVDSDDVYFEWDTLSPANNTKIYTDVDGSKVTFRERQP
jgi:hypothetical protein